MRYQAILFDLDNTLYDYTSYWRWRLRWSLEPVAAAYPHLDDVALAEQAIGARVYARNFAAFLQQSGVTDEQVCSRAVERYRHNFYERLTLYPDALSVLQRLRQHYQLGLITNGPAHSQRPKIAHFDLASMFEVILVSEEVALAKPDPAIFHLALRQMGVAPAAALYVGDSLEHDLAGAQAAGVDFVWMNPYHCPLPDDIPEPVAQITHLERLLPLLLPAL